jgi:hypothetical protein
VTSLNDEPHVLAERHRRMAEVYRADAPTESEALRAHVRLAARTRRAPPPLARVWTLGLAQGFVAGLVTLAAASFVGAKVLPRLTTFWSADTAVARSPRAAPAAKKGPTQPAPRRDAPGTPAAFDSPPNVAFPEANADLAPAAAGSARADRPRSSKVAPRPVADTPSRSQAAVPVVPAPSAAAPGSEAPNTGAAWTHVAEALAAQDYDRAEAALKGLAANGDPATRDAASLSRAELWIARGSGGAVRHDVERLSREGRTPLIRRRAAELLSRIEGF